MGTGPWGGGNWSRSQHRPSGSGARNQNPPGGEKSASVCRSSSLNWVFVWKQPWTHWSLPFLSPVESPLWAPTLSSLHITLRDSSSVEVDENKKFFFLFCSLLVARCNIVDTRRQQWKKSHHQIQRINLSSINLGKTRSLSICCQALETGRKQGGGWAQRISALRDPGHRPEASRTNLIVSQLREPAQSATTDKKSDQ